jgi:hypothetical protein
MRNKKLDQLIDQMENYLECWKQFNSFVNLGRTKKFNAEDDGHFLETKSVIVQELELILSAIEVASPTKDEIHSLIGNAPSLRYLSEMSEGALRNLENSWHKIYIGWHAILGQLKVRQRQEEAQTGFVAAMFARKKAA